MCCNFNNSAAILNNQRRIAWGVSIVPWTTLLLLSAASLYELELQQQQFFY
jgi:hypothetical protein